MKFFKNIQKYFNTLKQTGYINKKELYAMKLYTFLVEIMTKGLGDVKLTEEDKHFIDKTVMCLRNNFCLLQDIELFSCCLAPPIDADETFSAMLQCPFHDFESKEYDIEKIIVEPSIIPCCI